MLLSGELVPEPDLAASSQDSAESAIVLFQEPESSEAINIHLSAWETDPTEARSLTPDTEGVSASPLTPYSSLLPVEDSSLQLAVTSFDQPNSIVAQLTETLRVANGPPAASEMRLLDDDLSHHSGQIFFLDFDGETGVTYDGPVRVDNVQVYPFQIPTDFHDDEFQLIGAIITSLNERFASLGVTFTTADTPYPNLPPQGGKELKGAGEDSLNYFLSLEGEDRGEGVPYSIIYIGGDDSAFSQYGSFLGLAEQVDVGNQDRGDNAFVFSDKIFQPGMSAVDYATALIDVIEHEAFHLLGYAHADGRTEGLNAVAEEPPDGATITVTTALDVNAHDDALTLREAILISNRELSIESLTVEEKALVSGTPDAATRDTIRFAIAGDGVQTIFAGPGGLPFITDPVIIDGYSQPGAKPNSQADGFDAVLLIEIDAAGTGGNEIGKFAAGLEITAGNSVVKGLIINGAPGDGIILRGEQPGQGGGNKISGNLIGSFIAEDLTGGSSGFGNRGAGVQVLDSAGNQIGGANVADRNIISGNAVGVVIANGGSTGNSVQGNWIGTDATGISGLGNTLHGVLITALVGRTDYASENLIGGDEPGEGNVISGNGINGVTIVRGEGNQVYGNLIGTNKDGNAGLGNGLDGVELIDARGNFIGAEGLAGNVISANIRNGISITGENAIGNRVQNNLIGTDLTGFQPLGNGQDGIFLGKYIQDSRTTPNTPPIEGSPAENMEAVAFEQMNRIGGVEVTTRNIISANKRDGVHIESGTKGTLIIGNYIGLTLSGDKPIGNQRDGVAIIDSSKNLIGLGVLTEPNSPFDLIPRNVISANVRYGVYVSGSQASDNSVHANFIGVNKDGTIPPDGAPSLGNSVGVFIDSGAKFNLVGQAIEVISGNITNDPRNLISGNGLGIAVFGDRNSVRGNLIGTDVSGTQPLGNKIGGVHVSGTGNTIGGDRVDVREMGEANLISGNLGFGIRIGAAGTANTIKGNFIGTDITGLARLSNTEDGVLIDNASGNVIGGSTLVPGFPSGNLISGNQGHGVFIRGPDAATNVIIGNVIGLSDAGLLLGNTGNGVRIEEGHDNVIGGAADGEGNVISGNSKQGIEILNATRNGVLGNLIGTDKTGTLALGNNIAGVLIQDAHENIIGGTADGARKRNVISGNIGFGVDILGKSTYRNQVLGNYIGTDKTGTFRIGNTDGVLITLGAFSNTIGGLTAGERNIISGNLQSGLRISDFDTSHNLVKGNYIGVGADGVTKLGNDEHGIFIDGARYNTIGGAESGAENIIAYNGDQLKQSGHGVVVVSGISNLVSRNSVFENAGRGIDLGSDSFTLNDVGDEDIGANDLQNYPYVTFVKFSGPQKVITWNLNSTPNSVFTIEFFANEAPDPSGFGEGKMFLASKIVNTDANGFVEFSQVFEMSDNFISVTATDPNSNTSEFSLVDTDGDSLADAWENASISGIIDIDENGIADMFLAGRLNSLNVEVNWQHKDLFVEVDAMSGFNIWGFLAPPTQAMLDMVVQTFARAPAELVQNPDAQPGITLHAFLDDIDISVFPFSQEHKFIDLEFQKLNYFGTGLERSLPNWTTTARAAKQLFYRYALFADTRDLEQRSNSGFAQLAVNPSGIGLGTSDFALTLGSWVREKATPARPFDIMGGADDEQAGTFMHELGHTLGLFHGGDQIVPGADGQFGTDDDGEVAFKPNYHSIMNYIWQLPEDWMSDVGDVDTNKSGIIGDSLWALDYSRRNFGDLDENALIESDGIGGEEFQAVQIGMFPDGRKRLVNESGAVDFNGNGFIDPAPVTANINGGAAGQLLRGFEDWSHLRFNFRDTRSFVLGSSGKESLLADEELTLELRDQMNAVGDGPGFFKFSRTNTFRVEESGGFATITVVRSTGVGGTVTVDFAIADGTALAGEDYEATSGTLIFNDGEYLKTFTIAILNDVLFEDTETILVVLSNPTGGATLGQNAEALVSIRDDDGHGEFQFSSPSYLANENGGSVTMTVTRSGGTNGAASVKYTTQNDLATAGQDYVTASGTLNFANGESSKTFTINILDDSIVEGVESVRLVLSDPSGGTSLGAFGEAILIILDVEPGVFQFSDATYQIDENGATATIFVTRTNGTDGTVTVNYATSNGIATAGSDYTATSGALTFADGEPVKSFTVPIINDTLAELTETINLTLTNPTAGAVLGTPKNAQLRVIDDEPPTFVFNAASFDVNETAGSGTVQIFRLGNIDEVGSVEFTTADVTARAGVDYVASSSTVRFAAGETLKSFNVSVVDDKLGEGIKTLQVILRNPSVGAQLGTPVTATLRIIDDETINAATFVVTNTNDSGAGSLRQAILNANARLGTDFITFSIPGAGVKTIRPLSALPTVTSPVTIDGYSQPGASPNTLSVGDNAVLLIELDGSTSGSSALRISAGNSIVRGMVINSAPSLAMIQLETGGGNLIEGNFIGTDATGMIDRSFSPGVRILNSSDNAIGGTTPSSRNIISGNTTGISIESTVDTQLKSRGNRISGNYIGIGADGASPLGNSFGILIDTNDGAGASAKLAGNTIGGTEPGASNVIAYNSFEGVSIKSGIGNAIRGNSIYSNDPLQQNINGGDFGGLGINLVSRDPLSIRNQSITLNDRVDADTGDLLVQSTSGQLIVIPGGNRLQNYPVLSSAINSNGTITIQGRLDSAPNSEFLIDFYANDQMDPTGYGEGKTYLGAVSITTDILGHADFTVTFSTSVPNGRFITATATDAGNNTSEFSARITVGDVLGSVYTVNTTDDVDDGIADAQHTSLREAIHAANNHPGRDTIIFNIPGAGVQTIRPRRNLPAVTDAVTIDGYSQPGSRPNTQSIGFDGILLIEIGAFGIDVTAGLILSGGDSTLRGLVINRVPLIVQGPGNNIIEGNIVGLDPTGNIIVGGGGSIRVTGSSENTIGGATPESRNVVLALTLELLANQNRVQGNYIGTRADGMGGLTNLLGTPGITITGSSDNLIGGTGTGTGNIISGNIGVSLSQFSVGLHPFLPSRVGSSSNRLLGNFIGVGADGALPLSNNFGVYLTSEAIGNTIGGIQPGAGNVIAWNRQQGVFLESHDASIDTTAGRSPSGNAIRGNSIYSNGLSSLEALGINIQGINWLENWSVSLNDNDDFDGGGNNGQNFPVLESAISENGAITIQGRLDSTANTTFQIDFYANEQFDRTGYGEGQTYIGTTSTTTNATGHANFSVTLPVTVPNGRFITTTATSSGNDTSEFSARITVGDVLGSVFIVNTTDDIDDGVADARHTSLREAIHGANNHPGRDTIIFNIPGDGVRTISPLFNLPAITDPVTIDGYTQPGARPNTLAVGNDAVLLVELNGSLITGGPMVVFGLYVRAGETTIRGLVINRFTHGNMEIEENGHNSIEGNFIGATSAGTLFGGNGLRAFGSSENLIGGTAPQARNLFAVVEIRGDFGTAGSLPVTLHFTSGNLVQGNEIGSVRVQATTNNIIGGTAPGTRNVIGSVELGGHPVQGTAANNVLQGNYIGTDRTGTKALGGFEAIFLSGKGNLVGGPVPGAGNVIGGAVSIFSQLPPNAADGDHVVQGNFIGVAADGTSPLGNRGDGILIRTSRNLIGGTGPGAANIISGNAGSGIVLTAQIPGSPPTANLIRGNLIGTQADGVSPLGNVGDGIRVDVFFGSFLGAANDTIGGLETGGNVIAFNGGNGINLAGGTLTAGTGIAILGNSIYSNGKLGIDLKGNGPTANDPGDGDTGDNNLQNFPVITSVSNSGASITITGTLNSRPSNTYRLEFFDNVAFDSSNFGEGRHFIGFTNVTTDGSGNANFTVTFQVAVPLDHIITSTATDSQGNTSEFSGRQVNGSTGAAANLSVTKSDTPDPILVGELLTYNLSITNNGPAAATNVILIDTLPSGVSFDSVSGSQGIFNLSGTNRVLGRLGTVASGATVTVQIKVLATTEGTVTNSVSVWSDQYDANINDNTASASTTILSPADLSITKTVDVSGPVAAGSRVRFTINVINHGPGNALNIRVTDTLPSEIAFERVEFVIGTFSDGIITVDLGNFSAGTSVTFGVFGIIKEAGTFTNTAQVSSSTFDTNLSNNTSSVDVTAFPIADLALTKTVSQPIAEVGEELTYTLTLTNKGPSDAESVIVTDVLPEHVSFASASVSQGSFVFANGTVAFNLGRVADGSTVSAQIVVIPTVVRKFITNAANVDSATEDPNLTNNQTVVSTVVPPVVLYGAASIEAGPSTFYALDPLTGAAAPIGPIGFRRVSGMDFDPTTGILYATGARSDFTSVLITIDPATGAGTEVRIEGSPTNVRSINNNSTITDISFRNSDGMLFAFLPRDQGDLATIDIKNGHATAVGGTAVRSAGNGLAFSRNGTLYHANDVTLNVLNPETGFATILVDLSFPAPADFDPRFNAMDFDPKTGILFGSLNDGQGDENENYLATVNIATGEVTIIGRTVNGLDAIAFLPAAEPVNHPPELVAIGDQTVNEGETLTIDVSATDLDVDSLAFSATGLPSFASFADNHDGTATLNLNPGFSDAGLFAGVKITVSDGTDSDEATFSVTVINVNRPPVAQNDSYNTDEDQPLVVTPLGILVNDSDADGNTLSAILVEIPRDGTLTLNADGSFTYRPKANFFGTESFSYKANDGTEDSNIATVNITVDPVNDAPVANDDTATTTENTPVTIEVLANDSDVDGTLDPASITIQSAASHGTLSIDPSTGKITYTAAVGFSDSDSFTYTVKDDQGLVSNLATVRIEVQAASHDAPQVSLITDPCDPDKTALQVVGTDGDDKIRFVPRGNGGDIKVLINGRSQGIYRPTGRIIAYGLAGNDDIEVAGNINLIAMLNGDAGNDRLKGGAGASVLCGGDGDDLLISGSGRSILIGGTGADRLVGNGEDDILIGGYTSYGCDHEALCEILEIWTRRDLTYAHRINNLSIGGGLNGVIKLNAQTVFDDGAADTLNGAAGLDWFFAATSDKITDRHPSEITTQTFASMLSTEMTQARRRGLFDALTL